MRTKLLMIVGIAATATIDFSSAATVSVTDGGLGTGVFVSSLGVSAYSLEVGGYEFNIFTPFSAPAVDKFVSEEIAGSFTRVGPASLNSAPVFLRVSTYQGFAILSTGSDFPADVSGVLDSSTVSFNSSASGSVVASGGYEIASLNGNSLFLYVPEPSTALLGAFVLLGLLRRHRI